MALVEQKTRDETAASESTDQHGVDGDASRTDYQFIANLHGMSMRKTIVSILTKGISVAGLLTVTTSISAVGFAWSMVLFVLAWFVISYGLICLWHCVLESSRSAHHKVRTYEDVAYWASGSKLWAWVVTLGLISLYSIMTCALRLVFAAEAIDYIRMVANGTATTTNQSLPVLWSSEWLYRWAFLLLLVPLTVIRSPKGLYIVTLVGAASLLGLAASIIVGTIALTADPSLLSATVVASASSTSVVRGTLLQVPLTLANYIGSTNPTSVAPALICSMKHPDGGFKTAAIISLPVVFLTYLMTSLLGSFAGLGFEDQLTLPALPYVGLRMFAACCIILASMSQFLMTFLNLGSTIDVHTSKSTRWHGLVGRILVALAICAIAVFCSSASDLFNVTSSTLGTCVIVFLPVCFYIRLGHKHRECCQTPSCLRRHSQILFYAPSKHEWWPLDAFFSVAAICIGAVAFIGGTYASIVNLKSR